MANKKHTISEFNEKQFAGWKDIKSVTPILEKMYYGDEEESYSQEVITRIDINFKDGEKISIVPESSKVDLDEDEMLSMKLIKYKPEEVNFKSS